MPFQDGPLIPGFYMPLCVKDPKVLAALQESKSGETPYAGAFLLKDDKDPSTSSSVIHQVGTLAQVTYRSLALCFFSLSLFRNIFNNLPIFPDFKYPR